MKKRKILRLKTPIRDMKKIFLIIFCILHCALCINLNAQDYPSPSREFRGAWLSTVWAIDWPSARDNTESAERSQKDEMCKLLDQYKEANMNVCFFQVRGFSDAFYNSAYEPWSQYLCGERGKAPNYDPLQFVIDECHKRGIECHAWINPYRYASSEATYGKLPTDYSNTHPDWLLECGSNVILNPGIPEVRQRIVDIVVDIINKYDVDGIVFDDYFYPNGGMTNDKDQAQYDKYNPGELGRGDWRRQQVNLMVEDVYDAIKARKPWVRFGISPAGVACTDKSVADKYGITTCPAGSDWQYDGIYSDPLAWVSQNIIDYISPQVYWTIGAKADYSKIVPWWGVVAHKFNRHNYVSCSLSDLSGEPLVETQYIASPSSHLHLVETQYIASQNETHHPASQYNEDRVFARIPERQDVMMRAFYPQETVNEIVINRNSAKEGAPGMVFFSTNKLSTRGFINKLTSTVYSHKVLPPALTWYRVEEQAMVTDLSLSGQTLTWNDDKTLRYGIYAIPKAERNQSLATTASKYLLGMSYATSYQLPEGISAATHAIAVTVIDGYANEFAPRFLGEELQPDVTPQLVAPLNDASVVLPTSLLWQDMADALSYTIELAYDADFDSLIATVQIDTVAFFTQQIAKIDGTCRVFWRVKANVANARSNWSETRSFTGKMFSITSPAYGASNVSVTPTITWDNVGSGVNYTCEIAKLSSFSTADIFYSAETKETSLTIPKDILNYNTDYYVRVKAVSSGVNAISNPIMFTTQEVVMVPPVIIEPADGDIVSSATLKVVVGETPNNGFRFELSAADHFPGRKTKTIRTQMGIYSAEYTELEPGDYYIRVATLKTESTYTDFSDVIKVTYNPTTDLNDVLATEIFVADNILHAPADLSYTIYTITGSVIANGQTAETTQLPILNRGVYLITVDSVTLKYVVR